jgi:tol-pal system protein YbgF
LALSAILASGPVANAQSGLFGSLFGDSERWQGDRAAREDVRPVVKAQMSDADLVVRLERLENQIRQLTGAIEQLQFRNQQLEQQARRNQEDMEYRFQELGGRPGAGGGAPARPRTAAPPPPPPSAAPPPVTDRPPGRRSDAVDPRDEVNPPGNARRRSDAFDPRDDPNAPGVPRVLGSPDSRAPSPIMADEPAIGAPGGRQAGTPLDLSTLAERISRDPALVSDGSAMPADSPPTVAAPLPPPPRSNPSATGAQRMVMAPTNSPRDELALAQGYIQRKDYALGEEALRDFLKKHPRDGLVVDAHYWLGESLYQQQRYRDAAESFLTISTKHEKSARAPEALLRLGQSLAAIGEREASCATFAEVARKYPKAAAAKQGAEREQKRARC